jgi:DNA-binding transcriptional LysR family regulator
METKKLSALLESVRMGSLSKAASKLDYTQSGLTQMINALESEIGILLLRRDHNGVTFTREGVELEPFIEALISEETALRGKVSEIIERGSGKIRIGAYPSIASYVLPEIIKIFREQNANVEIEIKIGVSEIPKWVESGEVDLGLAEEMPSQNFKWTPVFEARFYAVVPASFSSLQKPIIPIDELIEYPVLIPTLNGENATSAMLHSLDIKSKILVSSSSGSAILPMVEQGLGVSILSGLYMQDCPPAVRMYPTDPPLLRTMGIIMKPSLSRTELIQKFVSCYKTHAHLPRDK